MKVTGPAVLRMELRWETVLVLVSLGTGEKQEGRTPRQLGLYLGHEEVCFGKQAGEGTV